LSFNIRGDKTRPTKRICDTCCYSTIVRGSQQGQEVVICSELYPLRGVISWPVVECTSYLEKGSLTEQRAERIGWVLEVKAGKVVGFIPPKKKSNEYDES
jgi:hypothetical protein